ncbi:hypothetical protein ACYSNR_14880 [Enterococcus sp. LJL128]
MKKDLRTLRIAVEEKEAAYLSLKKKTADIPSAYEESRRVLYRQKEIWERVLHFAKGTDSERQIYQKLDELEESERELKQVFSLAEDELEEELTQRKSSYEEAEQGYEQVRKEEADEV